MGGDRRQERAREFGRCHPRLTVVIACVLLGGVLAACAVQLRHGAYLGRGWMVAALAGMLSAAMLSAAVLIGRLWYGLAAAPFEMAWLVLGLMSASAHSPPRPARPGA